jgi:hypothetical protein
METENERSDWTALADLNCAVCAGRGLRGDDNCNCVLRKIARCVLYRVDELEAGIGSLQAPTLDGSSVQEGYRVPGHRAVEYIADVDLTARRVLAPKDLAIFNYHLRAGHDWRWCCARVGLDRGNFYHRVYAILAVLGRTWLTLTPYPLFPVKAYWQTRLQNVQAFPARDAAPAPAPKPAPRYQPLRPPLDKPAPRRAALVVMPAPQPKRKPKPAAVHLDPLDPEAVAAHIRALFRASRSLAYISRDMMRLGVPVPDGGPRWFESHVRRVLLNGPVKRAA